MPPRRVPEHVRAELPQRAAAGVGLDWSARTTLMTGRVCAAVEALREPPGADALQLIAAIQRWLLGQGVNTVQIATDIRQYGHSGSLTVLWEAGPTACEVAGQFATGHTDDGLPLLPAWIGLKTENDFDLRWQEPY